MNFKTQPFDHQLKSLELAKDKEYWGHFHEMGAGKTKIAIDTANYLLFKGHIEAVVIIAPNGIHTNWAKREVPKHSFADPDIYAWTGRPDSLKAKRHLAAFLKGEEGRRFPWFCINVEAIRTPKGLDTCEEFMKRYKCMIVVDESTIIKNPSAKQTKAAIYLGSLAPYRRILTGTPITQGPLDFYSQCKFLHRDSIPFTSFTAFRNTFAHQETIVLNSGKRFQKIVGYTRLGYLKRLIQPFSDRILKEECLDLPEKLYQTVEVPMHQKQAQLYHQMKEMLVAKLESEEAVTGMITADNVLSKLIKLHQIVTGFVKDDEDIIHEIPNNRLEKLGDILEGFSGKAVIWCTFRKNIEDVCAWIRDAYGKASIVSYYGDTSIAKRSEAIDRFNSDPSCRFFVSNKTGSEGIDLVAAEYAIYYSNSYSLHTRLQSEDRCHRIGQHKNVLYLDLYSRGTVDQVILKCLKDKKNLADTVLQDWRALF